MKIKKGETVKILAGKDRGKIGEVLRVIPKIGRVVVKSLNMVKKHRKATKLNPDGGIFEIENPMHISNVQLIDQTTGKPSRVGYTKKNGVKERYFKRMKNQKEIQVEAKSRLQNKKENNKTN